MSLYDLEAREFDPDFDAPRCDGCNRVLDFDEGTYTDFGFECGQCSGLARCIDDLCHGQGYCMHNP